MAQARWASEDFGVPRARARDARARVGIDETPLSDGGGEATGGEDWLWRYRRELAPVWAIVALVVVANLGHLISPSTPLDPLFIVPSAGLLLLWRTKSQQERAFVVRATGPAILWTCGCWWAGLEDPSILVTLLVGGSVAVLLWLAQHRRSSIEVVHDGGWWSWAAHRFRRKAERELTNVGAIWPWIARCSGIPGAELHRLVAHHEDGYSLHIELPRGKVGRDIQVERLASALREFPIGPILTPDPSRPWEVLLTEAREEEPDDDDEAVSPYEERLERMEAERLSKLASAGERR